MDTLDYTVNCSILLTELPLLQRPQATVLTLSGGTEILAVDGGVRTQE